MVVQYVKALVLISLTATMSLPMADDPYKDKILYLANQEVQIAIIELGKAINDCRSQEGILNVSLFDRIEVPWEELTIGLFHLSMKARRECEREELWKNFLYALSKYRSIQHHYNKEEYREFEYEVLFHGNAWREMELEIKYREIDSKYRSLLESMPELSRPFNLMRIITDLERLVK